MASQRTDMHRLQELVRLHRLGLSGREVSQRLKMGRNTVRRYVEVLAAAELLEGDARALPELGELRRVIEERMPAKTPPQQASSVERYVQEIELMLDRGATPKAIYDALRLGHEDFDGSLSAVKRLCKRLQGERPVRAEDVAIPVETDPGQVAQVDFGYVGRLYDPSAGVLRRAWLFLMTLGFSRHMWAEIVFDQKVPTWLWLHQCAFDALGGVPHVVVPDNLKSAVILAAFGVDDAPALNRSYREMARYFDFQVDPTPPRSPEKKGKVERGVGYVKRNFFKPREFQDVFQARLELSEWVVRIAGERRHGTTGKRPIEVFEEVERARLKPLPSVRFRPVIWKQVTVHRDSHVLFDKRLYSVPWRFLHQKVWVRATAETVEVWADDERVATHARRGILPRSTINGHLPDKRAPLAQRSREYWEKRAQTLGDEVLALVREVFDSDEVLSRLRTVQGIVTLLAEYPRSRANAACARARHFGNLTYKSVKRILVKGLDFEPFEGESSARRGKSEKHRFARSPDELLPFDQGDPDERER